MSSPDSNTTVGLPVPRQSIWIRLLPISTRLPGAGKSRTARWRSTCSQIAPTPTKSAAAIVRSKPAALRILRTEACPDIERRRGRSSTYTVWQIVAFRRAIFQDISGLTTEYRADPVERLEADALHFT